jgi:hypothetical protein
MPPEGEGVLNPKMFIVKCHKYKNSYFTIKMSSDPKVLIQEVIDLLEGPIYKLLNDLCETSVDFDEHPIVDLLRKLDTSIDEDLDDKAITKLKKVLEMLPDTQDNKRIKMDKSNVNEK